MTNEVQTASRVRSKTSGERWRSGGRNFQQLPSLFSRSDDVIY